MKTKLFFFTSLLLLSIATATAQTKEKGFFVEMNGGYGEVKTAFVSSTVENPLLFHLGYARYAVLTPSIGYQINRHWAAGFKIQFESIMEDEKKNYLYPLYAIYLPASRQIQYLYGHASFCHQTLG